MNVQTQNKTKNKKHCDPQIKVGTRLSMLKAKLKHVQGRAVEKFDKSLVHL